MVLADILKRWQILQGKTAILSTGTDEHGMKVYFLWLCGGWILLILHNTADPTSGVYSR